MGGSSDAAHARGSLDPRNRGGSTGSASRPSRSRRSLLGCHGGDPEANFSNRRSSSVRFREDFNFGEPLSSSPYVGVRWRPPMADSLGMAVQVVRKN